VWGDGVVVGGGSSRGMYTNMAAGTRDTSHWKNSGRSGEQDNQKKQQYLYRPGTAPQPSRMKLPDVMTIGT